MTSNIANKNVDILAVRPMTLDATKHACQTYDADIISLDFHAKHVVPNHATAQLAIQRGMFFEVCYAPAFRSKWANTQWLMLDIVTNKHYFSCTP